MNKDNILKAINKLGKGSFKWSKPITDEEYLNTKKNIYNVNG